MQRERKTSSSICQVFNLLHGLNNFFCFKFLTVVALPNLWYYEHKSFWTYVVVNGQPVRPRNETCSKFYYICARTTFDEYNVAYYSSLGLAILVPTIAFLFCYVSIIIFVRRHVVTLGQRVGSETRIARNRKTLRLILGLIFLNIVCRLPVWTFVVVTNIKETPANRLTLLLMYSFHLLSNVNSLINPFVYAIFVSLHSCQVHILGKVSSHAKI